MDILSVFAQRSRGARLIAAGRTTTIASIHDLRQLHRLSVDLDMLFNFYRWHWEQFEECREWDIRRREQRLPGLNQTLSRVTVLAGIAASLTYRTYLQGLQRPTCRRLLGYGRALCLDTGLPRTMDALGPGSTRQRWRSRGRLSGQMMRERNSLSKHRRIEKHDCDLRALLAMTYCRSDLLLVKNFPAAVLFHFGNWLQALFPG